MKNVIGNGNEIIIVDDSDDDLFIAKNCHRISGVENTFVTMRSGVVFLDYLEQVKVGEKKMPAIVLMDVNMPEMSGFDVVTRTRRQREFKALPTILMFTNSDSELDQIRTKEVGADGLVTKPIGIDKYVNFFTQMNNYIPVAPN